MTAAPDQPELLDRQPDHPQALLGALQGAYATRWGVAYCGDALGLMQCIPDESIDLVVTSPPYALEFQKEYGNVAKDSYVPWFLPFAREIRRILKPAGSFFLNIGGSYNVGTPTRSLYHFKLLIALCEELEFHLAQELFWYNPAKLPAPAEWVNVRRIRVKDAVEYIWWLSPNPFPKASNRSVIIPYSDDMIRLIERGYRAKGRPSGHNITAKFQKNNGGAIPSNLLTRGNNESNSNYLQACKDHDVRVHPARFPAIIPEFAIKLTTDTNDVVLDPFAGSNVTGFVAENLHRRWLAMELESSYVSASRLRFQLDQ